jgi:hypothetical protein
MRRADALWGWVLLAGLAACCGRGQAQAALLMEKPFGVGSVLDPTGHEAIYFKHICAATPVKLRRCGPGEAGAVIARYHGIAGYDWVAIPLVGYLYAVDDAAKVPERAGKAAVLELRQSYHDAHLMSLGSDLPMGGAIHRGWGQLVGAAYERGIYAFQFATSEEQDDALMERLNAAPNRSHFNLEYRNCADFAAEILNFYFPGVFRRRVLPDAGITTPRQNAWELERYARRHAELGLKVLEIPVVPGWRRKGRTNQGVAGSLVGAGYVVPLAVLSPYAGAAVVVDWLVFGRYPLRLKGAEVVGPGQMGAWAR